VVNHGADAIYLPGQARYAVEALHVMQSLMGLKVPEDVSIIGTEALGWSLLSDPPLTTIYAPFADVADRAVELMHMLLAKTTPQPSDVLVPVSIIERRSVRNRT
jgi:LacI family transcriptional regulator